MLSYAQNFEDVYIYRAFKNVAEGFYIDVGAYDPTEDSVTKFFYDRGWWGVNVEPGPSFDRFPSVRPRDINLRCAVDVQIGKTDLYYHVEDPGTSTLRRSLDANLRASVKERRKIEVETLTLDAIFEQYAAEQTVHFLKIDIEGLEQQVIAATDWQRHRPILILTEATRPYTNDRIDEHWTPILEANGYRLAFFDGINTYYLREEDMALKSAFLAPVNVLDGFQKYFAPAPSVEPSPQSADDAVREVEQETGRWGDAIGADLGADITPGGVLEDDGVTDRLNGLGFTMADAGQEAEAEQVTLAQALRDSQFRNNALSSDLARFRTEATALRNQVASSQSECAAALQRAKEADERARLAEARATEADTERAALRAELEALRAEHTRVESERERVSQALADSQYRSKALDSRVRQVEVVLSDHEALREKYGKVVADAAEARQALAAANAEISVLRQAEQRLTVTEAELISLRAACADLESVRAKLKENDDQLESVRAEYASLIEHASRKMLEQVAAAERQSNEWRLTADNLQQELNQLKPIALRAKELEAELSVMTDVLNDGVPVRLRANEPASRRVATLKRKLEETELRLERSESRLETAYREQALIVEAALDRPLREIAILEQILDATRAEVHRHHAEAVQARGRVRELEDRGVPSGIIVSEQAQATIAQLETFAHNAVKDQDNLRANLTNAARERDEARESWAHIVHQHQLLVAQFDAMAQEREQLYNHLRLGHGPRALKMVLPAARAIRFFSGFAGPRPQGGPPAQRPASRSLARVVILPPLLWIARRFPGLTRSIWHDVRVRAPDLVSNPPVSAPPAVAARSAMSASASDPTTAAQVEEALLSMTLQKEMRLN